MLVSQNSFMKRHVKGLSGYLSVKNSRVLKFDHDTQSLPTYLEACANIFIALSELMIIFWHHHSVLIVAQDSDKNSRRHFGLEIHCHGFLSHTLTAVLFTSFLVRSTIVITSPVLFETTV